jgi:hypothetical protein
MSFQNFFIKGLHEFDVLIIGIFGRNNELGEGKTLLLSYMAYEFHKQFPEKTVYADYNLPFIKNQIHHINEFVKCENCAIFLDDCIPIFDARQSGSNVLETWILNACRKYKISLIYTAQLKGAIDGRLRKISNFIFETEKKDFPRFEIWAYNKNLSEIDNFEIEYGKEIQNIYNTYEVVKRQIRLNDLVDMMAKFSNRVGFRQITKAKYNFRGQFADTVYTLLQVNDINSIKELLIPHGFELIELQKKEGFLKRQ